MEERQTYLRQLPFWEHLSPQEQEDTLHNTTIQHYSAGSLLRTPGQECPGLLQVLQGKVRAYLLSEEGREVTLFRMGEGEFCALSAACILEQIQFDTQMIAMEDCRLLVINPQVTLRLLEGNVYARCYIYERMTRRFSQVMQSMQKLLFLGVDQRLADFLLRASEVTGEVPMTHEQIAQQISSAREVVARTLKKFAAQGLVESRRGLVRIADREGLEDLLTGRRVESIH